MKEHGIVSAVIGALGLITATIIGILYSSEKNQNVQVIVHMPQEELENPNKNKQEVSQNAQNNNLQNSDQITLNEKKVSASKDLPQTKTNLTSSNCLSHNPNIECLWKL